MITIIHDRIALGIEQGLTLDEIKALDPTLDYDGLYSVPEWTGEMFVEAIYHNLSNRPTEFRYAAGHHSGSTLSCASPT